MFKTKPDWVVVRDRTHLKDAASRYRDAQVMTAKELFDRVRFLTFMKFLKLRRDDQSIFFMVQQILAAKKPEHARLFSHYGRHFSAIYHGNATISEVYEALKKSENSRHQHLQCVMEILSQVSIELQKRRLITGAMALKMAHDLMIEQHILPPFFKNKPHISCKHLVDLTTLEIDTLIAMAKLDVGIEVILPLDLEKRGVNLPINYLASQFEKHPDVRSLTVSFEALESNGPLTPFVQALFQPEKPHFFEPQGVQKMTAQNVDDEAEKVAQWIATKRAKEKPIPLIALVVRTLDDRTLRFKEALKRYGVPVRDRKGQALLETSACKLLFDLLSAKNNHLRKPELIGILAHPLWKTSLNKKKVLVDVQRALRLIGKSSDLEDEEIKKGAYSRRWQLLSDLNTLENNDKECIADAQIAVQEVGHCLDKLNETDCFHNYFSAIWDIINDHFLPDEDPSLKALRKKLRELKKRAFHINHPVLFSDFQSFLREMLSSLTIPHKEEADMAGVELLLLPEVMGRQFDYVCIVDMALGRLPLNPTPDPLLKDSERLLLNQLMKKPVLRLFFDDPFEPSFTPARQALEPFWFLQACASAKKGLLFSMARKDQSGQEQAAGEFFEDISRLCGSEIESDAAEKPLIASPQIHDFLTAKRAYLEPHHISAQDPFLHRLMQAAKERNLYWAHSENGFQPSDYAFSLGSQHLSALAISHLGQSPNRPLTPTFLEALSSCTFKGFVDRVMQVPYEAPAEDDLDARLIGSLAHGVLEGVFRDDALSALRGSQENCVSHLMESFRKEFQSKLVLSNPHVADAHFSWLKQALERTIEHLRERSLLEEFKPFSFEVSVGLARKGQKQSYAAVPIRLPDKVLYIGGIIDRIDLSEEGIAVIDYKLGTLSSIRNLLSNDSLFRTHFQLPMYLRLMDAHLNKDKKKKIGGYFVSIKDADSTGFLGFQDEKGLLTKSLDDDRQDGLAAHIARVLRPLFLGSAPALMNDACSQCRLQFVCRHSGK